MPETSEEIVKLISKSTELISYYSAAKEHFEAEINKLRSELNQQKSAFDATTGQLKAETNQLKSQLVNIPQESWQQAALVNGWVNYDNNYNTTEYFKDRQGVVHLKGLIKLGTAALIFNLPPGYRPVGAELYVVCTHPNIAGRINIEKNGDVWMVSGSNEWISLDGITFRAA